MKKVYWPYLVPFLVFIVFIMLTYVDLWIPHVTYILYPLKTIAVGAVLYYYRKSYTEIVFKASWIAILVGILVFIVWVLPEGWGSFTLTSQSFEKLRKDGVPDEILTRLISLEDQKFTTENEFLDAIEKHIGHDQLVRYTDPILKYAEGWDIQIGRSEFNPYTFGKGWIFYILIAFRLIGAVIVVPIMEELFWRSFAIRWLIKEDFTNVSIGTFTWFSCLAIVLGFGFEHHRWLVGLLAGILYNALLYYKKNISDCIIAHAVTNLLLGIYVLVTQQWTFW